MKFPLKMTSFKEMYVRINLMLAVQVYSDTTKSSAFLSGRSGSYVVDPLHQLYYVAVKGKNCGPRPPSLFCYDKNVRCNKLLSTYGAIFTSHLIALRGSTKKD